MEPTFSEQLRLMLKRQGITLSALAEKTGQSAANLSAKLKRNSFDEQQMRTLAQAINCEVKISVEQTQKSE